MAGRSDCFELCAEGNIRLIASATVPADCEAWINTIAARIQQWSDAVLSNLKPNIVRRLGSSDQAAVDRVSGLGPMELLRLVVVAAYHSFFVADAFAPADKYKSALAGVGAPVVVGGGVEQVVRVAKPVAYFEASDFLCWLTDAELVESRREALVLGSLVLKHGWIRSAAESKGQGKAESTSGSAFDAAVGSVYHFVGNFGSVAWMGWLRVAVSGAIPSEGAAAGGVGVVVGGGGAAAGGGGGGFVGGIAAAGGAGGGDHGGPTFGFWQLVSTMEGLYLQRLADLASESVVESYFMRGFLAVDAEGDALRFRLERRAAGA